MNGPQDQWKATWTVERKLGEGGQGVVRLVRSRENPTVFGVLKTLKRKDDVQARLRMQREVVSIKMVRNEGAAVPAIIDDHTVAANSAEPFFVMEFIDGTTLDDIVKQSGPLTVAEAVLLALDICRTVQVGHKLTVFHRDIKPDNIVVVLGSDGHRSCVVLDYGLSFNAESLDDATQTDENFKNQFLILPEYNVAGWSRRDSRSDLTAICGILFFLLCGKYPRLLSDAANKPPHRRPDSMILQLLAGDPHAPHLDSLFQRGFNSDLELRFQSIEQLTAAIQEIVSLAGTAAPKDPREEAAKLATVLRRGSRQIQLHYMLPLARQIVEAIHNEMSQYGGIEPFTIGYQNRPPDGSEGFFMGAGATPKPTREKAPKGMDLLAETMVFEIRTVLDHKPCGRHFAYSVCSNGDEIVVLRCAYKHKAITAATGMPMALPFGGGVVEQEQGWVKVYSFLDSEVPTFDAVLNDVRAQEVECMHGIAEELQTG